MNRMVPVKPLRFQEMVQIAQHPCCRPPDEAVTIRHRIKRPPAGTIGKFCRPDLVIGTVHEKRERHLENFRHFIRIGMYHERWRHDGNNGRDPIPAAGTVFGQRSQNVDMTAVDTDFLFHFSQCRFDTGTVGQIDTSARKADLPRMIMHMQGTLCQHQ